MELENIAKKYINTIKPLDLSEVDKLNSMSKQMSGDLIVNVIDDFIDRFDVIAEAKELYKNQNIFNKEIQSYRNILSYNSTSLLISSSDKVLEEVLQAKYQQFLCKKMTLDKMTDMIAKEVCFNDENMLNISRFQYLVNNMFNKSIKTYMEYLRNKKITIDDYDILFLFKGGTTMKILYLKYKAEIGDKYNQQAFFDYFKSNFERSDSDYGIYINPNLSFEKNGITYELVYNDINRMTCVILKKIREIINMEGDEIVPFNLITPNILLGKIAAFNKILEDVKDTSKYKYCDNLRKIEKFVGIGYRNNIIYTETIPQLDKSMIDTSMLGDSDSLIEMGKIQEFITKYSVDTKRKDFTMGFASQKLGDMQKYVTPFSPTADDIYLSINETNEFVKDHQGQKNIVHFMLQRLKVNFVAYYRTVEGKYGFYNIPSELVDVSIVKKDSNSLFTFYEHVKHELQNYKYVYNNQFLVTYKGYTIYGNIKDLILALFYTSIYPWDDNKYLKRIKRLMFFMIVELLIFKKDSPDFINTVIDSIKVAFSKASLIGSKSGLFQPQTPLLQDPYFVSLKQDLSRLLIFMEQIEGSKEMAFYVFFRNILNLLDIPSFNTQINKFKELSEEIVKITNLINKVDKNIQLEKKADVVPQLGGYRLMPF